MKARDVHQMSYEELKGAEARNAEELFRLRFQHHTGQLTSTSKLRGTRRDLARIKTRIRELELEHVQLPENV